VEATKLCFKKGDIIFARRRAYQRKLGVAEFDGICSAHAMVLRPRTDIVLPEFLPFFIQSDLFMNRAVEISVGSLSPTINWKTLAMQQFTLPSLEEQRRIAEFLRACSTCEESYQEVKDYAFQLMQAIIGEFINSQPKQFDLRELIVDGPQNGLYVPSTKYGTGTPILRIDAFYDGKITGLTELKEVIIDEETIRKYALNKSDIVINRVNSRAFVGKSTMIPILDKPTVFESNMMRFSVDNTKVEPEYLNIFLNHPYVKHQVLARCKDAINQSSINQ
jgi:restriction endonuclease S subunit